MLKAMQKYRRSEIELLEYRNQFYRRFRETNTGKWADKDQPHLTYKPLYE